MCEGRGSSAKLLLSSIDMSYSIDRIADFIECLKLYSIFQSKITPDVPGGWGGALHTRPITPFQKCCRPIAIYLWLVRYLGRHFLLVRLLFWLVFSCQLNLGCYIARIWWITPFYFIEWLHCDIFVFYSTSS